jgi:hypothetical protein
MRLTSKMHAIGTLGISLMSVLLTVLGGKAPREGRPMLPLEPPPSRFPGSPSEEARRGARWARLRAEHAANLDREALEAWDPDGAEGIKAEPWRLQLMTADRTGDLARARRGAHRAAALARTPEEAASAAELLALIEHDTGHHDDELLQARRLVRLRPRELSARSLLHRAEQCQVGLFEGGKSKASTRRHGG